MDEDMRARFRERKIRRIRKGRETPFIGHKDWSEMKEEMWNSYVAVGEKEWEELERLQREQYEYERSKIERVPGVALWTAVHTTHSYRDLNTKEKKRAGIEDTQILNLLDSAWLWGWGDYRWDDGSYAKIPYEDNDLTVFSKGWERDREIACAWRKVKWIRVNGGVKDWVMLRLRDGRLICCEPDFKLLMERYCVMRRAGDIREGEWLRGLEAGFMHQVVGVCHNPPAEITGSRSASIKTEDGFYDVWGIPGTGRTDIESVGQDVVDKCESESGKGIWKEYEKTEKWG